MRAAVWHGRRDVRVDTVPDPTIEEPTDAIVRITSTGLCGSDLHLYEVMAPFMTEGDILGHEPMGIVEAVGSEVTNIAPGDRVVIPFNISCGHCLMCDVGLQSQCETTQVREYDKGAALFGYTKLYGQVPGGQAELLRVPQAQYGPIKVPHGPPDDRFVYLSDVLPTAWQAVQYAAIPDGGTRRRPRARADRVDGVPGRGAPRRVPGDRCRPRARAPRAGRLATAPRCSTCVRLRRDQDDVAAAIRDLLAQRGPDSVIDAVGMEAHGSGGAKFAQQLTALLPDKVAEKLMSPRRHRPAGRAADGDRGRAPRRHDLARRRLRRHDAIRCR